MIRNPGIIGQDFFIQTSELIMSEKLKFSPYMMRTRTFLEYESPIPVYNM